MCKLYEGLLETGHAEEIKGRVIEINALIEKAPEAVSEEANDFLWEIISERLLALVREYPVLKGYSAQAIAEEIRLGEVRKECATWY